MATQRKLVFRNGFIYHVFNRGIEKRAVFTNKNEYFRAQHLIKYYRHKEIPIRFSQLIQQPIDIRQEILDTLYRSKKIVNILAYCLMPNHFHFMLKQNDENGISKFAANFTNAYTKYFNTKHERIGPLFQGEFKAVIIENDEQAVHLSRYIHLNPVTGSIIKQEMLNDYVWSSYIEYISLSGVKITNTKFILNMFKSTNNYIDFISDQIEYAKTLDKIKHLTME